MPMSLRIFGFALAAFLLILPVPGTIALRYALLGMLLLISSPLIFRARNALPKTMPALLRLAGWHAILLIWLLFQALFFSPETAWALGEIRGQWLPALSCVFVAAGAIVAARLGGLSRPGILAFLISIMLLQSILSLAAVVPEVFQTGSFPQGKTTWTAGKLEISYWNNVVLAFLAVDLFSRWRFRHPVSKLKLSQLLFGGVLLLLSNLSFGARNGVIGVVLLIISLAILVLWNERKSLARWHVVLVIGGTALLFSVFTVVHYKLDPRWKTFSETAVVAWDIDGSRNWLNPDSSGYPKTTAGGSVDPSAYLRLSWIHAGLKEISEHPLGVGFGRNAFGHALRERFDTKLGHSHSGLIDWTLGAGLPGLFIWLMFLVWLGGGGMHRYLKNNELLGLIQFFVVGGFLGRMFLDSINRDHMLMLFFFVTSILYLLPEEFPES